MTTLFIKLGKFLGCNNTNADECYDVWTEILLGSTIIVTVALHAIVAIHILFRRYIRASNQVMSFNQPEDLVSFSPGYLGLLGKPSKK